MDYVNLGKAGVKVSRICFGCMTIGTTKWRNWVKDEEDARALIRRALDLGINYFDTANAYSDGVSEEVLGRALRDFGPGRDRVIVATKVFFGLGDDPNQKGLSRKNIFHSVDASLKRLGMDYVDLLQIHRFDPTVPIEETLDALDHLIRVGKARYIGASSMYAWQFQRMLHASDRLGLARFVTMQNHYNLVYREEEREMNPLCRAEGIGLIPWSPLARGLLADNRRVGTLRANNDHLAKAFYTREADERVVDRTLEIAKARGVKPTQVALAWLQSKPEMVAPILGATSLHHIDEAVAALDLRLSPEEIAALEAPYEPHPIIGHT